MMLFAASQSQIKNMAGRRMRWGSTVLDYHLAMTGCYFSKKRQIILFPSALTEYTHLSVLCPLLRGPPELRMVSRSILPIPSLP